MPSIDFSRSAIMAWSLAAMPAAGFDGARATPGHTFTRNVTRTA